jgi:hypothetical protein
MIVRWEYNTVAMAKAQKMVDVYEMLEKHEGVGAGLHSRPIIRQRLGGS